MVKNAKKSRGGSSEEPRGLLANLSEGIIVLDRQWKITYINKKAEQMLNRPANSLVDKVIWDEFPDAVGRRFYQTYHEVLVSQKSSFVEDYSEALGRWTQAAVYPFSGGLAVYFHDVTKERKAQAIARETENRQLRFLERISDGFIALDNSFCYTYANPRIGELTQRDPASLIGKNVWEIFPEAVGSDTYKAFHTALKEQRFISHVDYYPPLDLWQENYIYPSPEGLSVFIRDISDRKRLEKELRDKEKEQQFEIMITALEAQEKERTYIGQELHDNVNQLLVATKLMLSILKDHPDKSAQMLSSCISNLEKAIDENRKLSHVLVTPDLKQQPLSEQLGFLMQNMLAPAGINVQLRKMNFNEGLLDEQRKLAIYRIAQEQCTNIIKHSRATEVVFTLVTTEDNFTMTVSDNGKGMPANQVETGIGLKNIQGRISFFEGSVRVQSQEGKGFTLEVNIPIKSLLQAAN